jgi:hypothetical protein
LFRAWRVEDSHPEPTSGLVALAMAFFANFRGALEPRWCAFRHAFPLEMAFLLINAAPLLPLAAFKPHLCHTSHPPAARSKWRGIFFGLATLRAQFKQRNRHAPIRDKHEKPNRL